MTQEDLDQLHARRAGLRRDAAVARAQRDEALQICSPYDDAWGRADRALRELHDNRAWGEVIDKATMLAAYDARMAAGFARNPFKKKHEELGRWFRTILNELDQVEAAIDEISKRKPRKPRRRSQPTLLDNLP